MNYNQLDYSNDTIAPTKFIAPVTPVEQIEPTEQTTPVEQTVPVKPTEQVEQIEPDNLVEPVNKSNYWLSTPEILGCVSNKLDSFDKFLEQHNITNPYTEQIMFISPWNETALIPLTAQRDIICNWNRRKGRPNLMCIFSHPNPVDMFYNPGAHSCTKPKTKVASKYSASERSTKEVAGDTVVSKVLWIYARYSAFMFVFAFVFFLGIWLRNIYQ